MRAVVHGCTLVCREEHGFPSVTADNLSVKSVTCKLATETYQADSLYDLKLSGKALTNKKYVRFAHR